jgi:hypothetical protein
MHFVLDGQEHDHAPGRSPGSGGEISFAAGATGGLDD